MGASWFGGLGVGIILYYLINPQSLERHRLYISDDVLNSGFRQLHKSRLLAQWADRYEILERKRGRGKKGSVLGRRDKRFRGEEFEDAIDGGEVN
jgi:hypothetical protein